MAETLNFKPAPGLHQGGTIHIIANNQLGFTTESSDARSTAYAGDLAKGFEIPVVHVNADDPEACLGRRPVGLEYRCRFRKDFLIDLVGIPALRPQRNGRPRRDATPDVRADSNIRVWPNNTPGGWRRRGGFPGRKWRKPEGRWRNG